MSDVMAAVDATIGPGDRNGQIRLLTQTPAIGLITALTPGAPGGGADDRFGGRAWHDRFAGECEPLVRRALPAAVRSGRLERIIS
jgi:hypothetical protein